jgi:hypothetical protein
MEVQAPEQRGAGRTVTDLCPSRPKQKARLHTEDAAPQLLLAHNSFRFREPVRLGLGSMKPSRLSWIRPWVRLQHPDTSVQRAPDLTSP